MFSLLTVAAPVALIDGSKWVGKGEREERVAFNVAKIEIAWNSEPPAL